MSACRRLALHQPGLVTAAFPVNGTGLAGLLRAFFSVAGFNAYRAFLF